MARNTRNTLSYNNNIAADSLLWLTDDYWRMRGGDDWERERGEARGCEIVCMCMCVGARGCTCVDAGVGEGQSEICNALLN